VIHTVPIRPDRTRTTSADASPPDPVPQPSSAATLGWTRALVLQIERNKRYPAGANGEQGTVKLAFRMDRDGNLVESRIVQSSGFAALDQETLALVSRAQPFPAPPVDISDAQLSFVLPIHYASPPSGKIAGRRQSSEAKSSPAWSAA
jgi:protein TonB